MPASAAIDPRTGEPARPLVVQLAAACCWLAVAVVGVSLGWVYWDAVFRFHQAAWLTAQFQTEPGSAERVLLAVALTAAAVLVAVSNTIVGHYAWVGYRWTRIAGLVSAPLGFLALLLNPLAWAAPPLAVVGAGLLWLPAADAFFTAWEGQRQEAVDFAPAVTDVVYGPVPRYRALG